VEQASELEQLSLDTFKRFSPVFEADVFEAIRLETVVNRRLSRGGTGEEAVRKQLEIVSKMVEAQKSWNDEKRKVANL
jgi:argininosuccinate lyase